MTTRRFNQSARRAAGILLLALAATVTLPGAASAENFFESLFGGFSRPHRSEPVLPPRVSSYADPRSAPVEHSRPRYGGGGGSGRSVAYCVRTCDGRYFPLQRHAHTSTAETCRSLCPAAKTVVFSGSKIDHAVASNGKRYADLDNAFVYRKRVVDSCTCNGKDAFGLARVNVANDPTLRSGDIVVTNDGLTTYHGGGKSKTASAEFTPIDPAKNEWSRRLSEIRVAPQPEPTKVEPVAQDDSVPGKARNAHASR